jgi:hypothetical protein
MASINWILSATDKGLKAAINDTVKSFEAMEKSIDKTTKKGKEQGDTLERSGKKGKEGAAGVREEFERLSKSSDKSGGSVRKFGGELQGAESKGGALVATLGKLGLFTAVATGIGAAIRTHVTAQLEASREAVAQLRREMDLLNQIGGARMGKGGASLTQEVEDRLLTGMSGSIIPRSERLSLGANIKRTKEDLTADEGEAGVRMIEKTIGVFNADQRAMMARNIGMLQKIGAGYTAQEIENLSARAVTENVDLESFDKTFGAVGGQNMSDNMKRQVMALVVGAGKGGQGERAFSSMIASAQGMVGKPELDEEATRRTGKAVYSKKGYASTEEAMAAILRGDEKLEGTSQIALDAAKAQIGPYGQFAQSVATGDMIGEARAGRDPNRILQQERALAIESAGQENLAARADRDAAFSDMIAERDAQIKGVDQSFGGFLYGLALQIDKFAIGVEQLTGIDPGMAQIDLPMSRGIDASGRPVEQQNQNVAAEAFARAAKKSFDSPTLGGPVIVGGGMN